MRLLEAALVAGEQPYSDAASCWASAVTNIDGAPLPAPADPMSGAAILARPLR